MAIDLGNLLRPYAGGAAPPPSVDDDFDEVARQVPPGQLSDGLAAAFRSDNTPPFGQMVGQLFGGANPNQRAGMLTSLIAGLAPAVLSSLASRAGNNAGNGSGGLGGILGRLLPGSDAPPTVTPDQAATMSPAEVEEIAAHAEKANPGIVDQMSSFYAEHPQLVKGLGAAALAIALGRMANSNRG